MKPADASFPNIPVMKAFNCFILFEKLQEEVAERFVLL
jgi:hypothetical protein